MVRPRSRQGFTLVEMMLVVAVAGVLSAMIMPGLAEVMADNRQAGAAEGLVRMHRIIRARVNQTGLAHVMMFDEAASNSHGDIRVFEGMNNHCHTTPWAQLAGDPTMTGHYAVATLDMLDVNHLSVDYTGNAGDDDRQVITVRAFELDGNPSPPPLNTVNLCLQPNGMTYIATIAGTWTFQPQTLPLQFTFHRSVDGLQHGVDRRVIFPIGGNARLRL